VCGSTISATRPAPDPAGGAYSAPQTPSLNFSGLLRREGRDERGRRGGQKRAGREKEDRKDRVGVGERREQDRPQAKAWPQNYFLAPALWKAHIGLPISVN